jgi:hypothetical protein
MDRTEWVRHCRSNRSHKEDRRVVLEHAQAALRRGRRVLFVPDDIGSMSAEDFQKLLSGLLDEK